MNNAELISIVLPSYNREKFISQALEAIQSQTYTHWELIIVDDGGSDNTEQVVQENTKDWSQNVKYIKQENQGPAIARNTGIKEALGDYVAFYDSDDIWLSHHLKNCHDAFTKHPELDWVYGACQRIDYITKSVILPSTFYNEQGPNPLFNLKHIQDEKLYIIADDGAAALQIEEGIDSGLQNSMIRAKIFQDMLLPAFRIGEDRLFIAMALKKGYRFAFIDDIHVHYIVHDENISDTNINESNLNKRVQVMEQLIASYQKTPEYINNLTSHELEILNARIADDCFWKLGYALLWQHGDKKHALKAFKDGMKYQPYNWKFWKTYIKSWIVVKLT